VDLAHCHPFSDVFECNFNARLTDGGTRMSQLVVLGEDEEFKPSGMSCVHFSG